MQALVYLTTFLEFFYNLILFVILDYALGYSS
jgi:hypothetical protein